MCQHYVKYIHIVCIYMLYIVEFILYNTFHNILYNV